jgi:two-component system chemotaxis sensor kinase CheA
LDMSKYRDVFLEEATDHLAEMSRALLDLEKDPARAEAIDVLFRMAHSIKGMAASLEYESIAEVAHHLEDRMQEIRAASRPGSREDMALLFRGLEGLERLVAVVRETGGPPPHDPELAGALKSPPESGAGAGPKKA